MSVTNFEVGQEVYSPQNDAMGFIIAETSAKYVIHFHTGFGYAAETLPNPLKIDKDRIKTKEYGLKNWERKASGYDHEMSNRKPGLIVNNINEIVYKLSKGWLQN